MITLDDVLASPKAVPEHPVVKWLNERKSAEDAISVEVQKDSAFLGSSVSGLIVRRKVKGDEQPSEIYQWDDELNTAIINLRIRATDIDQEGERFALVLRAGLRKVERKYGDGYLNSVLVDLIDDSSLGKDGEIGKVRRAIHLNSPSLKGQAYSDCRDMIAGEIGGMANDLRDKLEYNPEQLKAVLDRAIAQYLDKRFSVSNLRKLGWIDENGLTTRRMQ